MKAVFEEMEAEVDQNAIDKKYREIERKNLLITNENLIANCIAQDVFYTVTDSTLSASRFNDLSTAYNVAMNRVVDLESENSRLLGKIEHDDHDTMIKAFSKLEVAHVNLQLKQQHLKENANNLKTKSPRDVPEFDVFFELGVKGASAASGSKPRSNTKKDRTLPARSALKQVEAHSRMNKSNEKQENRVDSSISSKRTVKQTWKPTGKIFTTIGYHWKSTGRIFPLGDQCPLTRITKPKALPVKQWKPTGRLIPLDGQCPLVRPPAPTNSPNPVASNLAVIHHHPQAPQSSPVHYGVATEHSFEVNPFAKTEHEPFVNVFAPYQNSEASSSGILTITTPNQSTQPHEHLRK
ncbi:hypothetical protein Tco_0116641 [Tanacetum coccineum]